jgi:anti-sigma factor RsiW
MTDHDALRQDLGVLALGKLDEHERRPILAHADECPECGAELDDFLAIAALLWSGESLSKVPGDARCSTRLAEIVSGT